MRHLLLASALVLSIGTAALANGYDESRSYRWPSSNDMVNKAITYDVILKKKNGYYDGFDTFNNNKYITNHNGDVINCTVQASAVGNSAQNGMDATTGSNFMNPTQTQTASATGNNADNDATNTSSQSTVATGSSSNNSAGNISGGNDASGSDFSFGSDDQNTVGSSGGSQSVQDQLNNNQTNSGNQNTDFNDNTNTYSPTNTSANGTTNQTLNNNQDNSGDQHATVKDSTGCTFN